jgi:hypothetical protein
VGIMSMLRRRNVREVLELFHFVGDGEMRRWMGLWSYLDWFTLRWRSRRIRLEMGFLGSVLYCEAVQNAF